MNIFIHDICSVQMSGDPGVSAFPEGDNLFKWVGTLAGPKGTVCTQINYR